jgi:hypothetical protein
MSENKQLKALALAARLVSYNPNTGVFKWKLGGRNRVIGQPAGSQNNAGYLRLSVVVEGSRLDVMLHRLAVYIMAANKQCPPFHESVRVKLVGERTDLRWDNIQIFFAEQEEKSLHQQ